MDDALRDLADDLAAEHAALDALVSGLDAPAWRLATPADGWTIGDQIAHLAVTDRIAAYAANDPARFDAYRASSRDERTRPFDMLRALPPAELIEEWRAHRQELLAALHGLDPRARITWFGPSMSALSHATARLMETWAHGQDILDALEKTRPATARLKHIAHLGVRTRGYSYTVRGLTPPTTDVHVELVGPHAQRWTWGDPDAPDAVRGAAGDFCLVVVQRRHVDDTDLLTSGPLAREWLRIAQAYAGPRGPGRQPGQFPRPR